TTLTSYNCYQYSLLQVPTGLSVLAGVFSPLPSGLRLLPTAGKTNPAAAHHPGKCVDYNDKCLHCPPYIWKRVGGHV
ncbi:unnamed protein product, partial [Ectocarpus sp. 6 AP-2014]